MSTSRTFSLIKPDAMSNGHCGQILDAMIKGGFRIAAMKLIHLNLSDSERFYAVHKGKPFYEKLIEFMCSGPSVALVLEKDNAVEAFRAFIGTTDPSTAAEGTIRKRFATSIRENAVHGSDSDENARNEWSFFFTELDIM
jgi:nucleoside-diphosphate kinase